MKNYLFVLLISIILCSCGGRSVEASDLLEQSIDTNAVESEMVDNSVNDDNNPSSLVEDTGAESPNKEILEAQKKACQELKSWGAKDAYVDTDGYLVYVVNKQEITTSGKDVAKSMYELVSDVPGIKGVKVVDKKSKEELGRY